MLQYIQWPDHDGAQRLFHGRGHAYSGFEHVNIDWYKPLILITLYQEVESDWLESLVSALSQGVAQATSIIVQYRCRQGAPFEWVLGERLDKLAIEEQGLRYWLTLDSRQNTGIFLDMANGRRWVREQAKNKRVLNLFAYTCAFSVAALAGGADKVVNVDMSRSGLSTGRENHRLNDQDLSRVVFEGVDIFKSFGRLKKHGPYELIICDPPSFQKGSVDIKRDYAKIIRRIPQLAVPGAELLLCLNSPDLNEQFLLDEVAGHCPQCRYVERIDNPPVFVEAQQGKGLKVLRFIYQPD